MLTATTRDVLTAHFRASRDHDAWADLARCYLEQPALADIVTFLERGRC